jgi:hypothetical protein
VCQARGVRVKVYRPLDPGVPLTLAVALHDQPYISDQLFPLGQAQQDHARCQPQAKSGQVQHDPPLHAVDDVVIFCSHNPTLLFTLLDGEASGKLVPLLHLVIHILRYEAAGKKVPENNVTP